MATYYFVGAGIAALAGAAYLIRDAGVAGADIVLLEESGEVGGALDAHGGPAVGYFMSGSRMFEDTYTCTFDLLSSIPSTDDPAVSVTQETKLTKTRAPLYGRARLVDRDGRITAFRNMGFHQRDRVNLVALMAAPEGTLDDKRISDCFTPHFFQTSFWLEWCTLFAFGPWHSAIEFKRHLLRFIHRFVSGDAEAGGYRTRYDQYDSIAVPLLNWLRSRGVELRCDTTVTDLHFTDATATTVRSIAAAVGGYDRAITVGPEDRVFVTNGSMTANKRFGGTTAIPAFDRKRRDAAWMLWHRLAAGRPQFGNPAAFDDHIEESVRESFTVTAGEPTFFELMRALSESPGGTGGLITLRDSSWLLTLSLLAQPVFPAQPAGTFVWWGYGRHHDRAGEYVKKPMVDCTGREILEEVIGQLCFGAHRAEILGASIVVPCIMPFITSQFLVRKAGDRPSVIPAGSTNLAFIGQFAEVPDDVVFTVEYSIRSAQAAVYGLLDLDRAPTPMSEVEHDPQSVLAALA